MFLSNVFAQTIRIETKPFHDFVTDNLVMGNPGPAGKEIKINSKYMTLAGEPILPVMGEIHFSRTNPEKWEELILKMKANGITIISTYVFWIFHEEQEGIYDWSGYNNLRKFIELCKKHDVWAYPRIGPWCHGEIRNGGLPDWILKKEFRVRTNDKSYLNYVDRWYREISQQLQGLYYKDGGPVIGIQLENEYWRGKSGEYHILELKNLARSYGMDVPMYTVTGWRNASVPENEVIPLWGGYPAAPWKTDLNKISKNESFVFSKPINDQSIGHKEQQAGYKPDYTLYPYFTCELGVGNQISEHRRPEIDPKDGLAIATASVASGSNLPGYYVFTGGLNPVGKFSTLEENRMESGYWNEYPDISYDFQAAIRETGEVSQAYKNLKGLHYFLGEFGHQLATMQPYFPANKQDHPDSLQVSFRTNHNSGFLFVSNYYRGHEKSQKNNIQFEVYLNEELQKFPSKPIQIQPEDVFIWPINLDLNGINLKHATAQPICVLNNKKSFDWYFSTSNTISTEYFIDAQHIKSIEINGEKLMPKDGFYLIDSIDKGLENPVEITHNDGKKIRIFSLDPTQLNDFWLFKDGASKFGYISSANLIYANQQLKSLSTNPQDYVIALNSKLNAKGSKRNGFYSYTLSNDAKEIDLLLSKKDVLANASWLAINPESFDKKKLLYKTFFQKKFILENTADIKSSDLHLFTEDLPMIRINGRWLNQTIERLKSQSLDLTGYLKKGENEILMVYNVGKPTSVFAANVEVYYYNADKVEIPSDMTWLTKTQYKIPAPWENLNKMLKPSIMAASSAYKLYSFGRHFYELSIDSIETLSNTNAFLRINYFGDKIKCYAGNKLVADNFNNQTTWSINLSDIPFADNRPLVFEIVPYQSDTPLIYFDTPQDFEKIGIESIHIELEHSHEFTVK